MTPSSKQEFIAIYPQETMLPVTLFLVKTKKTERDYLHVSKAHSLAKSPPKGKWSLTLEAIPAIYGGGKMPLDLYIEVSNYIADNLEKLKVLGCETNE